MYTRNLGIVASMAVMIHLNICFKNDWFEGRKDPQGPYPRIPDREKLKKEIEFAKECKKHIFPPKERFIY